jgi:hypothetical protein
MAPLDNAISPSDSYSETHVLSSAFRRYLLSSRLPLTLPSILHRSDYGADSHIQSLLTIDG